MRSYHPALALATLLTLPVLVDSPSDPQRSAAFRSPGLVIPESAPIDPCKLLTREQVATVLPEHDGGDVAHAGGSLIAGVDVYQCSYLNKELQLFTVIVNVAVDDKRFAEIKPHFSLVKVEKVPVGEGGWLRGSPTDMKLTAVKGRSVLDLELMAPGAKQKSAAMVTLAKAALAHL